MRNAIVSKWLYAYWIIKRSIYVPVDVDRESNNREVAVLEKEMSTLRSAGAKLTIINSIRAGERRDCLLAFQKKATSPSLCRALIILNLELERVQTRW